MKILIAGYGSIGRRHLNNLRALGQTDLLLLRSHRSTLSDVDIQDVPVETTIEAALAHQPRALFAGTYFFLVSDSQSIGR